MKDVIIYNEPCTLFVYIFNVSLRMIHIKWSLEVSHIKAVRQYNTNILMGTSTRSSFMDPCTVVVTIYNYIVCFNRFLYKAS